MRKLLLQVASIDSHLFINCYVRGKYVLLTIMFIKDIKGKFNAFQWLEIQ